MQKLIEKLQDGTLMGRHNPNLNNLQDRLHSKTKENLTVSKIHDFLAHQILPQKAICFLNFLKYLIL